MPDNSVNNKRIIKNTIFLYARMFLLIFVGFYTTRVVLHGLGVDDFGLYNVVAGFVTMIAFVNTSLSNSIQRFFNFEIGKEKNGQVEKYFSVSLTAQLFVAIIIILVAETVGLLFLNTKMNFSVDRVVAANVIYQSAILTLVIKIFQAPFNAMIIAKERMQFYAYLSLIEALFQLCAAFLIFYVENNKLETYSIMLVLVSFFALVFSLFYSKHIHPTLSFIPRYDRYVFKELFSFCGWNLFGSASGVVMNQGINILINIFFNVAVNAARGVSFQVLSGIQRFIGNFQIAINPQIIQSYAAGERSRYIRLCYINFKISFYLMWILTLPLLICCENVLNLWLNDIPKNAIDFVFVILLTGLAESLGSSISVPIYATGDIKKYQIVVSLIRMSSLPISYVFYSYGYPAISALWVCFAVDVIAQFFRVRIWCFLVDEKISIYVKEIVVPILIVTFVSFFVSFYLRSIITLETDVALIAVFFIVTILLNGVLIPLIALNEFERIRILMFIKKNVKKS